MPPRSSEKMHQLFLLKIGIYARVLLIPKWAGVAPVQSDGKPSARQGWIFLIWREMVWWDIGFIVHVLKMKIGRQ